MQTQSMSIHLPLPLIKRLQIEIPQEKRSNFIAEAIAARLKQKKDNQQQKVELQKSLKANYDFYKKESKVWGVTLADGLGNI